MPRKSKTALFVGVDPGVSGYMIGVNENGGVEERFSLSGAERGAWEWLEYCHGAYKTFAVIEQQVPRPTRWYDKRTRTWTASILRSTCVLYGHYRSLHAMLIASAVPFEDCPPQRWQRGVRVTGRVKGEEERSWKGRLKEHAENLFPREKVTLASADALLIAEYCRREHWGRCVVEKDLTQTASE